MNKYASRKFVLSFIQLILLVGVPILFHNLGIGDDLSKTVLFGILGTSIYHVSNVLDGKLGGSNDQQN